MRAAFALLQSLTSGGSWGSMPCLSQLEFPESKPLKGMYCSSVPAYNMLSRCQATCNLRRVTATWMQEWPTESKQTYHELSDTSTSVDQPRIRSAAGSHVPGTIGEACVGWQVFRQRRNPWFVARQFLNPKSSYKKILMAPSSRPFSILNSKMQELVQPLVREEAPW